MRTIGLCAVLLAAAVLAAPPAIAQARARFEKSLAADPYFKDLTLDVDDSHAPLVFYVQPPRKRDAEYVGAVAQKRAALFDKVEAAFETSFGSDGGQNVVPDAPETRFLPLIVLTDDAEIARRYESGSGAFDTVYGYSTASFSRGLGAGIVYEGVTARASGKHTSIQCSGHDHVQVMAAMLMYERVPANSSRLSDWVAAGAVERFARRFDGRFGSEVDSLGFPPAFDRKRVPPEAPWDAEGRPLLNLVTFERSLRSIHVRELALRPFRDFALQRDSRAAQRQLKKDAKRNTHLRPLLDASTGAHYLQSRLLVDYLASEHGPAFDALLGDWFRGEPMGPAQGMRFPDPDAVDAGFEEWLVALGEVALPEGGLDLDAIGTGTEPGVPAPALPKAPATVTLNLDDVTHEERVALVFAALGEGRATDALTALDACATGTDPDVDAWLLRERERIEAWIRARDTFAASLPGSKTKIRVQGAQKSVMARVAGLDNGVLQLKKNSAGVTELPVDGSDPRVLARAMARRDRSWEAALAEVWTQDERAEKALSGPTAEVASLREDVAQFYGSVRASMPAVKALKSLVESASEPNWPATFEGMEAVRATIDEHRAAPSFAGRLDLLESWTAWRFYALAEDTPLEDLVQGEVELLDDGRVRLRYDFSSEDQLADFADMPDRDPTNAINVDELPAEITRKFETKEGRVRLLGSQTRVHVLTLGAPFRFALGFQYEKMSRQQLPFDVLTGFATGADGMGIWARGYGQCYVSTERFRIASELLEGPVETKTVFRVEATQEGPFVFAKVDDTDLGSIDAPPERVGRFTIASRTASIASLQDVVFEGSFGETERRLTYANVAAMAQARFWSGLR